MGISLVRRATPAGRIVRSLALIACIGMLPFGAGLHAQAAKDGPDVDTRLRERSRALEAADAELRAARQALEEAQRRQLAGKEPLPGERTGNVGGRSRLNETYFERQARLKQAVEQAGQRLEHAQTRLNELR